MSFRKPIDESGWFYLLILVVSILAIVGLERVQ
jgi:hypothetical protein